MLKKLEQKARVLASVRQFFAARDFLELDTPILQNALVPELHVPSFALQCPDRVRYLSPSPELAMKQVLCELGSEARSVYQLAHCFRREEQEDRLHSFEFSMLEFYMLSTNDSWAPQLIELVAALLETLAPELSLAVRKALQGKLELLSFDELCQRATGEDFSPYWDSGIQGMQELFRVTNGQAPDKLSLDDLFHLFLIEVLEPYINQSLAYCVLYPYPDATPIPAWQCSGPWVERWELYLCGVELANACREERRPEFLQHYRKHFEPTEQNYVDLDLWQGLPDCSGTALGISRLLAL